MDCIRSDESKASFQEKRAAFEQWLYSRQSQPNRLVVSFTESYPAWSTKKDFWTSDMSLSRAASRTSESSTSFIGNNSERVSLSASRRRSSDRAKPTQRHNFYAVNEAGNENSMKKRDRPAARFATIHGDLLGSTANQEQYLSSTDSGCEKDGHSPPLRHRFGGNSPIRAERRSQSVRSYKSSNNAASPSSQSSGVSSGGDSAKPASRRSFLKNLLFGHSKASSQTHLTGNSVFHQQSGSNSKQTGMAPLDTTVDGKKMKNSRSAFDVAQDESSPSPSGCFKDDWTTLYKLKGATNGKIAPTMKTFKPISGYDDVLATARVRPLPMRRERSDLCSSSSAFRLARHTERSPEPATATASGGSPALSNNKQHNQGSPPSRNLSMRQAMRPPPMNADDPQNINKCIEELRRKRLQSPNDMLLPRRESSSKNSSSSKPFTANITNTNAVIGQPQQMHECNNNDKQLCIEMPQIALRQRSNNYASWRGSRAEHRLSVPNLAPELPLAAERQTAKAIREKLGRNGDGELSVINEGLITPVIRRKQFDQPSAAAQAVSPPSSIANSMVNQHDTGVLPMGGTVARGREALEALFIQQQHLDDKISPTGMAPKFPAESHLGSALQPVHKRFLSDRNSRNPAAQPQIQSGAVPTPQSQQKESELVWRRAKNQSNFPVKPGHTTANGNQPHQRGSLYIPSPVSPKLPTGQSNVWNAVNSELKSRQQKIAKVRPTLQSRSNSNSTRPSIGSAKMPLESNGETAIMQPGVSGSSNREHRRSSDYAQLSDFATVEIGTARQSNRGRDDDAVSVAGTVFEEPWDSSAWENLLDLANHGDDTHAIREPIQEEDSDSDRTAGDSTRMHESDDEEEYLDGMWNGASGNGRRTLPSDRVTQKAWEREDKQNGAAIDVNSRYSTLDSRMDDSFNGSLTRQKHGRASPPYSLNSLPRPLSRFSQHQVGSIDDLPTALPSLSPILKGEKPRQTEPIGRSIQAYVEQLASLTEGPSACFGMTLRQFITCTKETKETEAQAVYRNVRQFMNGMKNYLVKHGEGKLHDIIEEESSRLSANQFLNIDAVLESVLHKLLIKEVKSLLYYTLVNSMARTGELKRLSHGLNAIRPIELNKYGFTNEQNLVVPSAAVMDQVKQYLRKMQHHYSPIKKLENLLKVIGLVLCCQKDINYELTVTGSRIPSRNDLVRWLVYIFTRTQTMCCEIEAYYMWELLPQQIYMQDSFYYLHALYTAISILKSDKLYLLDENGRPGFASIDFNIQWHNPSAMSGVHDVFITVAIPDEITGCIRYATMPNVPHMNTARLNRIIAHQHGITNPDDYGLYLIVNGFENLLSPTECPDVIRDRLRKDCKPYLFAFKRHEAKIAWPRQAILPGS